uniref:Tumor necrosis factor ligand superfamily member 10 n=1 Tax=Leptobrachium leishanense TaxID=445787 RepID=A0A8C5PHR7_9ANUR
MEHKDYFRSDSATSTAAMLVPQNGTVVEVNEMKRKCPVKRSRTLGLSVAMGIIVVVVLVSDLALFIHFSMVISKGQTQGMSEELRCLQLVNSMGGFSDDSEIDLDGLTLKDSCQKLVSSLKSYVTQVTENIIHREKEREYRRQNNTYVPEMPPSRGLPFKPSAHLMLRNNPLSVESTLGQPFQSCRFPIKNWDDNDPLSHVQNMNYKGGQLKIIQDGKYYVYSQIYFKYPNEQPGASSTANHELVQCINKKTSYVNPILLLKGIGTKCWASNAMYGLHSIHHGGVFELRSGEELFVSVSAQDLVHAEGASTFFGAFKLDF